MHEAFEACGGGVWGRKVSDGEGARTWLQNIYGQSSKEKLVIAVFSPLEDFKVFTLSVPGVCPLPAQSHAAQARRCGGGRRIQSGSWIKMVQSLFPLA